LVTQGKVVMDLAGKYQSQIPTLQEGLNYLKSRLRNLAPGSLEYQHTLNMIGEFERDMTMIAKDNQKYIK